MEGTETKYEIKAKSGGGDFVVCILPDDARNRRAHLIAGDGTFSMHKDGLLLVALINSRDQQFETRIREKVRRMQALNIGSISVAILEYLNKTGSVFSNCLLRRGETFNDDNMAITISGVTEVDTKDEGQRVTDDKYDIVTTESPIEESVITIENNETEAPDGVTEIKKPKRKKSA